ncbi:MAG: ATPase, T2SS/T4P/T4SS family [Acidimicrobiales bacterium]|nr:ATPase, T2SS/T4P/T4SS family [Acidimicrobiales bacterium]
MDDPAADTAGVQREQLLRAVVEAEASDVHCRPGGVPVLRVNGDLVKMDIDPLSPEDVARIAQSMLDSEQQEDLIRIGSVVGAHSESGVGRFRFSAYRQRGSVAIVFHAVPDTIRDVDELGLPAAARTLATADRGLVLVASPVGHGATTTLTALVDHANSTRAGHVVTVEDPIEVLHRDDVGIVSQLEVGADVRSSADGIRVASRLDADVVAVSDIVDRETALAVIDASARGRLVLATIGGDSVTGAIHTFLELFTVGEREIMRAAFARACGGVLAQKLIPATEGDQVAAVEAMVHTPKIESCLTEPDRSADLRHLMADGEYYGMQTMDQALALLVRAGRIDRETGLGAAVESEELRIELLR